MVPVDFEAGLLAQAFKRTHRGAVYASVNAENLLPEQLALLRRFTGATPLKFLLAPDEPVQQMVKLARALKAHGLIAAVESRRH
jgi:hypothetical protein